MQYTYVPARLPENKMRIYPTKVINIISLRLRYVCHSTNMRNKSNKII